MKRRELTNEEREILRVIQSLYGPQNDAGHVFFSNQNEAVIFIKDGDGVQVLAANLTNLSNFRADGTIASEDELVRDWLSIPAP